MLFITPAGTEVLGWLGAICLSFIGLIVYLRYRLHHAQPAERDSRTKLAGADAFALSPSIHRLALCAALGLSVLAINWTQYQEERDDNFSLTMETDDFDPIIPPTIQKPPPPPPPPPPPVIETVEEPDIDPPPNQDQTIDQASEVIDVPPPVVKKKVAPPPLPPPPPAPKIDDGPVIFAERMPVFGDDCKLLTTEAERKSCSDKALLQFLSREINYPSLARENGIEGRAVISFTVEKDGSVADVKVLRDPGGGLGAEAERVIQLINTKTDGFRAGSQQGLQVRVRFTVPILFSLD